MHLSDVSLARKTVTFKKSVSNTKESIIQCFEKPFEKSAGREDRSTATDFRSWDHIYFNTLHYTSWYTY